MICSKAQAVYLVLHEEQCNGIRREGGRRRGVQPIGEPRSGAIKHCKDLPVSQSQRKCGAEQEIEEKEDANEVKNKLSLANVTLSPLHVLLESIVMRIHTEI